MPSSDSNSNETQVPTPAINDEYENDSSDEEEILNTIGNVPLSWYEKCEHVGYTRDAKKLLKPAESAGKIGGHDEIDLFLDREQNVNFWRTVIDKSTGFERHLSSDDLDTIARISEAKYPTASAEAETKWIEYFTSDVMKTALLGRPEHKRSFVPSRIEALKVAKLVGKIKRGLIKVEDSAETDKKDQKDGRTFYSIWSEDGQSEEMRRMHKPQPAPKPDLPGHNLSYRPPPEYVTDEMHSYTNLRTVPASATLLSDHMRRCMSLYMCPRKTLVRHEVSGPNDLLPELPDVRDMQPYPVRCALIYRGHTDHVCSVSLNAHAQLLATCSNDGTVRVWEMSTARCLHTITFAGDAVSTLAWNPSPKLCLLAIGVGSRVYLCTVDVGDTSASTRTHSLLTARPSSDPTRRSELERRPAAGWRATKEEALRATGVLLSVHVAGTCTQISWHPAGDYFATVAPDCGNTSVMIHQLSRWRSQIPFSKAQRTQAAAFHPLRPYFFLATQNHVKIFNLAKHQLAKRLSADVKWISCMAIHPRGDNVVIGSHDRRVNWFDLDLSNKPYQRLKYHGKSVRQVAFHRRYPLMATAGDDGRIVIFHAKVSSDLLQNALIVPVKLLTGHSKCGDLCVLDLVWHHQQPWLFSSGADGTVRLWI